MTIRTAEDVLLELKNSNTFFSCTHLRKRDKKVGGEVVALAGEPVTGTYRFNVPATKKPAAERLDSGVRFQEDLANNVLTAYDVNKYDETNNEKGAFRRIAMDRVTQIKAKGKIWTPTFVEGVMMLEERDAE